jgi:hypothetical protein
MVSLAAVAILGCPVSARAQIPEWVVYNTNNSWLPHNDGYSFAIDTQGNVWRGTEGGGAARTDGMGDWLFYNRSNSGLPNDFVNDFTFDDLGNIWIATQGGGVVKFDGAKTWTKYTTSNSGLPYDFIAGVAMDVHGNLWIGTGRAHDGGQSTGGVAVYREGGVIPHGLGEEFARLTSATTTLGHTRVGQPTPLEIAVVLDTALEVGKTLLLDLTPLGPNLPLEHTGEGRYTVSTTITPLRNAQYNLPVVVQTAEGFRYRFFIVPLDVYPSGDLIIYDDASEEGWKIETTMGESDPASTVFVRTDRVSHAFGPGKVMVKYVCNEPEGTDLFGYSHLEFYINGGEESGKDHIIISKGRDWLEIVPEVDKWIRVSIPTTSLTNPLSTIHIRASVKDPFYIDDVRLVADELKTEKKLKQLLNKIWQLLSRKKANKSIFRSP